MVGRYEDGTSRSRCRSRWRAGGPDGDVAVAEWSGCPVTLPVDPDRDGRAGLFPAGTATWSAAVPFWTTCTLPIGPWPPTMWYPPRSSCSPRSRRRSPLRCPRPAALRRSASWMDGDGDGRCEGSPAPDEPGQRTRGREPGTAVDRGPKEPGGGERADFAYGRPAAQVLASSVPDEVRTAASAGGLSRSPADGSAPVGRRPMRSLTVWEEGRS
jgi:hypothetical protein